MFAGKLLISRVQRIHFWSLQVVYNIYDTTYDEILSVNNDVLIHQESVRFVVTGVFKSVNKLTISWRRPISYRNQSIDLFRKLMDWFLYDIGLRHKRIKTGSVCLLFLSSHVFTALEFHSNHFGILRWKIVKPQDHDETKQKKYSEKYSENTNQSNMIFWCPQNNFRDHLWTKFKTIITRYPTSERIKNAIT